MIKINPQLLQKDIDARLFMLDDGFVYAASAVSENETSRHAGVVLISLDDSPIEVSISKSKDCAAKSLKGHVIILAPRINRSISIGSGGILSVHFDPTHPFYYSMTQSLESEGARVISTRWFDDIRNELNKSDSKVSAKTALKIFSRCSKAIL